MELLKQYREEVDELEANRQELTNAEKLFELPITMYPELVKVQKEMAGMDSVYNIYFEQKVCVCVCACLHVCVCVNASTTPTIFIYASSVNFPQMFI